MKPGRNGSHGGTGAAHTGREGGAPFYEMRHVVSFEETNVVGNVYFTNHLKWMGRCRELFLRDHAPEVLDELRSGLALVTRRVSCEYLGEVEAFDEVVVHMRVVEMGGHLLRLSFHVFAGPDESLRPLACGEQELSALSRRGDRVETRPLPRALVQELRQWM